ncbi:peptide transporter [Acetobacter pomorum]|uniref:Peptide transporter n=1 Tax=Acetobacter pomorum TaxID=65959 RepID=A0A2G4RAA7_9PROT|nr:tetratricopeptide repeat protein [Acetobacter pomorum]PHY93506.1 peptide transporter [Acetobacter pomorum]GBR50184.1 O-linked N-acetylglucosamine transferase [Acetobacter pomorum DSM 11825]
MNTSAASAPSLPDQLTLRRARSEITAGHFNEMLAILEPFSTGESDRAKALYAYCLAGIGQPEKAAEILCDIAARHTDTEHPLQELSDLIAELDKRPLAEAACRAALQLTPHDARIYDTLANLLVQCGKFDEAVSLLRKSISLRPNCMHSHNLLAMALLERGSFDEALAHLREVLKSQPDHAGTLSNIGCMLAGKGQLNEALDYYRRAISLRPTEPQIRLNHSITLLKAGRYAQGWIEHEWRLRLPGHTSLPRSTLMPSLNPDIDIRGKRILITQEEGLGDTLMYLRYIRPLSDRGAIPHLWVPETLGELCRRVVGAQIVQVGGTTPEFDWHCPFISLPRVFSATPDAMGAPVPYLRADTLKIREMAALLPANNNLNVGLVWGGAPRPNTISPHIVDRRRSMNLHTLAPLGNVKGINLISLQKGLYAEQIHHPPPNMVLHDPTAHLHNMDDTAALIMSLDVVVTVDTSVVHLAGGLGKPVLLMDRYDNCWRWLSGRTDSPWYPTLQIIRQTTPRKWDDVAQRVAQVLAILAKRKK